MAVLILDGSEPCTDEILPCMQLQDHEATLMFAQIMKLNKENPEDLIRHNKSKRNHRVAFRILLDYIPELE